MASIEKTEYMQGITPTRKYVGEVPGGRLEVVVSTQSHDTHDRKSVMSLWHRHGYIAEKMPETLHCSTYYYDEEGRCWGRYNPQERTEGTHRVIDFAWVLAPSEENETRLVDEAFRLARLGIRK